MEYKLKEAMPAPDFSLMGSDGKEHKLSDYKGKNVALYFYPKDNTSGCTKEAEDFTQYFRDFDSKNTVIIGISKDSLKSHSNFINKVGIPFLLLSDENEEVINLYDVLKEKSMYGRKYMGVERTTFIIDERGIIKKIYNKVKVTNHVCNVLNDI
jgi:thioredoxin-dependent peroxiredoxin